MLICTKARSVNYISHNFWFLMCMFMACMMCWSAKRVADRFKISLWIPALLFMGCNFMLTYTGTTLPFSIDNGLLGAAFILIGYQGKELIDKLLHSKLWVQIVIVVICAAGLFICVKLNGLLYSGFYYMYINEYGNYALAQMGALFGSVGFFVGVQWVDKILSYPSCVLRFLRNYTLWVSDRTAPLFPIHLIIYYFLRPVMNNGIMFLLTLILIVPITNLIYKYIPFVAGEFHTRFKE